MVERIWTCLASHSGKTCSWYGLVVSLSNDLNDLTLGSFPVAQRLRHPSSVQNKIGTVFQIKETMSWEFCGFLV